MDGVGEVRKLVSAKAKVTAPVKTKGLWAWHVHHETLVELLREPIENRIAYIKSNKPKSEQATRLRLLRVVKDQKAIAPAQAAYNAAIASAEVSSGLAALHKKECKRCPWNSKKQTIFPKAKA